MTKQTGSNAYRRLIRNSRKHTEAVANPFGDGTYATGSLLNVPNPKPQIVIYVRTTTGNDSSDGRTKATAYRTSERAMRDVASTPPGTDCVINTDGAGEIGRQFTVKRG